MDEEMIVGEQPENVNVQAVATDDLLGTKVIEGSPLGKFKDAGSLLNAYNELEGEFTRKCQKLSETERKLQESIAVKDGAKTDTVDEEFAWKQKINEFLQSHKNASSLVEEITNEIINDNALRKSQDGLEKAYSRVMEKKYTPPSELVKDNNFLEKYVYSNDEIKNKIISEYISTLQNIKSPINLLNSGFSRGVASSNNVTTLDDARQYVEKMFRY